MAPNLANLQRDISQDMLVNVSMLNGEMADAANCSRRTISVRRRKLLCFGTAEELVAFPSSNTNISSQSLVLCPIYHLKSLTMNSASTGGLGDVYGSKFGNEKPCIE